MDYKKCAVCVVDVGSPRLGNLGWTILRGDGTTLSGDDFDAFIEKIAEILRDSPVVLGLEAPLFVPLRDDILLVTKARGGEARRPWSAGAGAQVLAMNIPIMTYLFQEIYKRVPDADCFLNADNGFGFQPKQVMVFEALVSGADKGASHIEDSDIMARYVMAHLQDGHLPPCIRTEEKNVRFINLAGMSLLHCGWSSDVSILYQTTPIYKPGAADAF